MVLFEELVEFLKHKGINDTFEVLSQFEDFRAEKHQFYDKLNEFSYYNAFFRVRDRLLESGLILIRRRGNVKYVYLTEKGKELYQKLKELNELVKS